MNTILEALQALKTKENRTKNLPINEHVESKFPSITSEDEYFFFTEPQMEYLNEDVENSMPVTILPEQSIIDFVMAIEPATKGRPLKHFKLGYISELTKEIAAKYKGGRGSVNRETGEAYDFVRIFKCTEYSSLETATNPRTTRMGLEADRILGTDRHTGERTGFNYEADEYAFRIGQYPDGSKALQACINADSRQRVKYFMSVNHSDLEEVSVNDILQYLTPAEASKLSAPRVYKPAGQDAEGRDVYDKPINRFKLNKIYMIGNLGSSIM
jgi:hypothetical protein